MPRSPLKPLTRALRIQPVWERRARTLTPQFEDLLFVHAELLSEGDCRRGAGGEQCYFGSTMITVDLRRMPAGLELDLRATDLETLQNVIDGSVRVRLRALRLALAEVARRTPGRVLGTAQIETRVGVKDQRLHIDVDLEVPILEIHGRHRAESPS